MNAVKMRVEEPLSQFDFTKKTLNNLSQYDITPTAKLVLLYLTSCYNPKHADVFPKQKTIADRLGVSERSVVRAIQELFKAGLILIECKYTNRYVFSQRMASEPSENLSDDLRQNDKLKRDNLSRHDKEQKKEQKNNKENLTGGNVYNDEILREYARKHGARNIDAYVCALKKTKSAEKIINEREKIVKRSAAMLLETKKQIEIYKSFKNDAVSPETCAAWKELGKNLGIKK